MSIYTKRLVGVRVPAGSGAVALYTHPGGAHVILRSLVVTNTSGSSGYLDLYIYTPAGNLFLLRKRGFDAESTAVFDIRQELLPLERIELYREMIDVSVLITGYVFTE